MLIVLRRSQFLYFLLVGICVITPIISVSHALSVQEKFSLSSPRLINNQLTLKVDEEVEIAIAITDASLGSDIKQVKHPDSNDFLEITETAMGVKLKGKKPTPLMTLTFTLQDARKDISVSVNPKVTAAKIKVTPSNDFPALTPNNDNAVPIKQNKAVPLSLDQIDGKDASDLVKLVSSVEDTIKVTPRNKQWTIQGLKPAEVALVEVRDKTTDEVVAKLKFKVKEATQNLQFSDITIRLKEPKPGTSATPKPLNEIFTLRGVAGKDFSPAEAVQAGNITIGVPSNPSVFNIVEHAQLGPQLVPVSAGNGTFTVTTDVGEVRTFNVIVDPVATTISFKPALPTVIVGQTLPVLATVLDKNGLPQFNRSVKWESQNPTQLGVVADNNNVGQLVGLAAPATNTPVKVRVTVIDDPTITQDLNVFVRAREQVLGFQLLTIRLDVVDEQMASDLFGKKTLDDLYVAKVRLYNNLRNVSGENAGDSILVFSESLEANVSMLKRCEKNNKSTECQGKGDQWLPLNSCDISVIRGLNQVVPFNGPTGQPAPRPSPSPACLLNTPFPTPTSTPQSGTGTSTTRIGTPTTTTTATATATSTPLPPTIDPNFPGRYRPYTFEMVANTHDRRDERSARSRTLLIANSVGTLTSFVTAIAVPPSSSDLPLGLDKYQNLLIPAFERLFPSLRESQRINLITQAMKPLEEVPFGSDITRIIFFPKKPLRGVLPGYVVKFTGISTYNLSAEAAIIKKNTPTIP
jgi:hypothetical protein